MGRSEWATLGRRMYPNSRGRQPDKEAACTRSLYAVRHPLRSNANRQSQSSSRSPASQSAIPILNHAQPFERFNNLPAHAGRHPAEEARPGSRAGWMSSIWVRAMPISGAARRGGARRGGTSRRCRATGSGLGLPAFREAASAWMEKRLTEVRSAHRDGAADRAARRAFRTRTRLPRARRRGHHPRPGILVSTGGTLLSNAEPYLYPITPRTNFRGWTRFQLTRKRTNIRT